MESGYDKIIRMLKDDLEDCGEPNISARPIAYGTILGLKMAISVVETVRNIEEQNNDQ